MIIERYELGGIAGHAGLFSTAEDLAVYAQMMLNRGRFGGAAYLHPTDRRRHDSSVFRIGVQRGLGWDQQTGYSSNRGELLTESASATAGSPGPRSGWTRNCDLFVIFLSNRMHPDGKGNVNPLAGRIGTIAAGSLNEPTVLEPTATARPPLRTPSQQAGGLHEVRTGIDVLERDGFQQLRGRRVGLITNQTGINREGARTAVLLQKAAGVELVALFSPEHGLEGIHAIRRAPAVPRVGRGVRGLAVELHDED